jgi:hypothetical protein
MSKTKWLSRKILAFSLLVWVATFYPGTLAAAQSAFPGDRKHDKLSQQTSQNQPIHADVDLALINVTVN